ncbi:MAG: acyl-CoA thioesterase [Steroidobacteraceae bacterium]
MSDTGPPHNLNPAEAGRRRGKTSQAYWNFTGPFGGVTAATLLRCVLQNPNCIGIPLSITVNFCAPVSHGEFLVAAREVRINRGTQHWYVEMSQAETGVVTNATIVCARRRATWSHYAAQAPEVPDPERLSAFPTEGHSAWLGNHEFRFASDAPQLGTEPAAEPNSALTRWWIRDLPSRPLDFISLTAMSDAFFGRIFHVRRCLLPVGTVSLTTHFHADSQDLASQAAQPVLGVADAAIFDKGVFDQTGQLWSRSKRLLASTHQIVYFRA